MKWIIVDGNFIPVENCKYINFTNSMQDHEYNVTINVSISGNIIKKSTYYSKLGKISQEEVESEFYSFIMDSCITIFDFYNVCKTIERRGKD